MAWIDLLRFDPLAPLLASGHPAVRYWVARELVPGSVAPPGEALWDLAVPRRILRRQAADGSWAYPGRRPRARTDYDLLETYRQLGFLVEMFGLTSGHPALAAAAEYVFSHQSPEGDLRGIYGNQYSPNYTAGLIGLLAKAGFTHDPRVDLAFSWFEASRQHDGGWALPLRTQGRNLDALDEMHTIPADPARPFSHLITGVVLRAYAAHPGHRADPSARKAAALLADRFFEPDVYPDKGRIADWTEFSFPFWMTDLVSALDAISIVRPDVNTEKTDLARDWLSGHQEPSGLFAGHLLRDRFHDLRLWFSLAVCRVFARMPS
ncbi:adenosine deaminase [Arthrobacter silvisoli]|uniref:adenosine deaminase n=1 Tax=Arthrobacter silvisoli TaxID=2291022 RepID=UPI001FE4F597|nr:adenosine deaminase [Arthrobacter silvisoli]